jgi:hypothetical protein
MHTPEPNGHNSKVPHDGSSSSGWKPEEVDASAGYEQSDVRVVGIVVFLTALAIFVAVAGLLTYGMGKVINAHLNKEDGPTTKWTKTADIRQLGDLANNPAMQKKVAELTQEFPTPRLQLDDGNQDVADLHQREDLLLDHYTWVDESKGKVRIPIERAMELIAQRGLPVTPAAAEPPLMKGDSRPVITMPLTNGFARTAYEQNLAATEAGKESK